MKIIKKRTKKIKKRKFKEALWKDFFFGDLERGKMKIKVLNYQDAPNQTIYSLKNNIFLKNKKKYWQKEKKHNLSKEWSEFHFVCFVWNSKNKTTKERKKKNNKDRKKKIGKKIKVERGGIWTHEPEGLEP